jgi:hypothetical protein
MISFRASSARDQADESQIHRELDDIVTRARDLPNTRPDLDPPITTPNPYLEQRAPARRRPWMVSAMLLTSTAGWLFGRLSSDVLIQTLMEGITLSTVVLDARADRTSQDHPEVRRPHRTRDRV